MDKIWGGEQRRASHWRCLYFSLDLPTLPGPLVLLVIVVVTSTLSLLMVCGVLILGKEHPAGMADSRLPTSSLSCVWGPRDRRG